MRGSGGDEDVLRAAGAEMCDLLMALTEGDNRNAMAAQLGKHVFGIPRVIAKINDPLRAEAYRSLGLETICRTVILAERPGHGRRRRRRGHRRRRCSRPPPSRCAAPPVGLGSKAAKEAEAAMAEARRRAGERRGRHRRRGGRLPCTWWSSAAATWATT